MTDKIKKVDMYRIGEGDPGAFSHAGSLYSLSYVGNLGSVRGSGRALSDIGSLYHTKAISISDLINK